MLQLKYPGVYTQEIPSGVHTITGAPTSVALFVGPTKTGIDGRAVRVLNFGDFERGFGGLSQTSNLSYAVLHFFSNGGGEAFVLRVPSANAKKASTAFKRDDNPQTNVVSTTATALSSGASGNDLFVEFDSFGIGANPFTAGADKTRFNLTVTDRLSGRLERFTNLSTSSSSSRHAPVVVNDPDTGSNLVKLDIAVAALNKEGPQASGSIYKIGAALPTGVPFALDIKLTVTVSVLAADGLSATNAVNALPVTVFANGAAKPGSVLELVTKLGAAINAAIRADAASAAAMEGVAIEAAPLEGNTMFRLRTAPPDATALTKRLSDATVTIADVAAVPNVSAGFLTTFTVTLAGSNPSRYRLGTPYPAASQIFGAPVAGADGDPNGQPDDNVFKQAVMDLDTPDPFFNILCLPDVVRPKPDDPTALQHANAPTIYAEAARVCAHKFAFLLVDPPPNVANVGAAEAWKSLQFTFQSNHAAAYFPNIRVDDPLVPGTIRSAPPSGAIAGVFARTDGQFGVWQAPAGVEASLSGVYGPSVALSDAENGILNPIGLNCIRQFPVYGTLAWGSRTVDGSDALASDWKYIPVRRTASYILRSLSEALRWAVHKPNGEQLWSQLRMNVTAFMHGLFRQGAFKGVTARDAYFVLCDASTTTQDDINAGVVNIVIGFAPLKPAEFVVISLRQIVQPAV